MAKQSHKLLWTGAAGLAGLYVYEKIIKPGTALATTPDILPGLPLTQAPQPAPVTFGPGTGVVDTGSPSGGGAPYVTSPTSLVPQPIQPSNLNPGAVVGGPVGTAMSRKNWTQQQATDRLNQITTAYNSAVQTLASLQNGGQAAQLQALIAANQAALAQAIPIYNQHLALGNTGEANQWKIAIDGHNTDIANLQAQLNNLASQKTAVTNEVAGLRSDYQALTGLTLG